jgi:hypothetical protein
MKFLLVILMISGVGLVFFSYFGIQNSFAHKDVQVGNITITAGWLTEPPLINNLNNLLLMFHDNDDSPIRNALKDITVNVLFGGVTKEVNFIPSEEEAGTYLSEIIPTQLGTYALSLNGKLNNQNITTEITIEDVEDTAKLAFPPVEDTATSDVSQNIGSQIKPIITDINQQIEENKNSNNETRQLVEEMINKVDEIKVNLNRIGLLSFIGIALGAAAIILTSWKIKFKLQNK